MVTSVPRRACAIRRRHGLITLVLGLPLLTGWATSAGAQELAAEPVVHRVTSTSERLELTVNTSRILSLDNKIPQAQVNNPDVVDLVALSASQVQVFGKKPGVTQVNLWDEEKKIYTIDIIVYADARELTMLLKQQFPKSALKVVPLSNSVIISGYIDDPNQIERIIDIAQDYHPKVINNITVAGAQQVLLQVKVMEVSRTKLRSLGTDFLALAEDGGYVASTVSGMLAGVTGGAADAVNNLSGRTFQFGLVDNGDRFFGILDLLQQRNIAKVLAEPNLVAVSGRPAMFNAGGEFPILVPQSLGTVSIQYRKFGTQIDFVPIVLGNGLIRLEVRPRVSEIDDTRSVVINSVNVPALKVREVDTGVEMKAGQTLAIAGLVQTRIDNQVRGLPWISDVPWIGAAFRRIRSQNNEIELLILVTPQLVDAMDPEQVPHCGPGMSSTDANDIDLYANGRFEVPTCDECSPLNGPHGPEGFVPSQGPAGGEEVAPPAGEAHVSDSEPMRPTRLPKAKGSIQMRSTSATKAAAQTGKSGTIRIQQRQRQVRAAKRDKATSAGRKQQPGFIGDVGYDVRN